ncbi:MAG: C25 family cysteine peptidase [Cyclobacteriaceae bacterium]
MAFFLFSQLGKAQPTTYGNEWIKNGQRYIKLKTAQNGFYRLSYNDLFNVLGNDLNSIDPRKFKIYHRGKQQAIYLRNTGFPNSFEQVDYIEFYGKKNDGTLDNLMYEDGDQSANPHYNLYSDTAAYFLTWNNISVGGNRFMSENLGTSGTVINFHYAKIDTVLHEVYSVGQALFPGGGSIISNSNYINGEGWHAFWTGNGGTYNYTFSGLENIYTGGANLRVNIRIATLDTGPYNNQLTIGNTTTETTLLPEKMNSGAIDEEVEASVSTIDGTTLKISNKGLVVSNVEGVSYLSLKYPQLLDMNNQKNKVFRIPASILGDGDLTITNVPDDVILYKITDEDNIKIVSSSVIANTLTATVEVNGVEQILVAKDTSEYLSCALEEVSFTNDLAGSPEFIILTHQKFWTEAQAYKTYRQQNYSTLLADVDRIYNQYSYGEKSPLGIRRFCKYLYDNVSPEFLFIIGKGIDTDYREGSDSHRENPAILGPDIQDYIPPAGHPSSDILYTLGLSDDLGDRFWGDDEDDSYVPGFSVGRLAAIYPEDVTNYLNKTIEHDSTLYQQEWKKEILQLVGGISNAEATSFDSYMKNYASIAENTFLGANTTRFYKNSTEPVEFVDVTDNINNGVQLVTIFGHSSQDFNDIDIGNPANDTEGNFSNKGKYPLLIVNGCLWGQIFNTPRQAEGWVNTPEKGAIATLTHAGYGIPNFLDNYSELFHEYAYENASYINQSIGEIQEQVVIDFNRIYRPVGGVDPGFSDDELRIADANRQQMILQGDPAIKLFALKKPDYAINAKNIIVSTEKEKISISDDSLIFTIPVINYGLATTDNIMISITKKSDSGDMTYPTSNLSPIFYKDTLTIIVEAHQLTFGENIFEIVISNAINEDSDTTSNLATVTVLASDNGFDLLSPENTDTLFTTSLNFAAQTRDLTITDTLYVLELDTSISFSSPVKQSITVRSGVSPSWSTVSLPVLKHKTPYYWRVNYSGVDESISLWSDTSYFEYQLVTTVASFTIDTILPINQKENVLYVGDSLTTSGDTPIGELTFSISGVDASLFSINPTSGIISLPPQNFENSLDNNSDNTYELTIEAVDELGNIAIRDWQLLVTDSLELANFSFAPLSDTSISENSILIYAIPSLTGIDTPIGEISFTIGGTDAGLFIYDTLSSTIRLNAKDFEIPTDSDTDNTYLVNILATDEDGNTAMTNRTVSINDLLETANFSITSINDTSLKENKDYTSTIPSLSGDSPIGMVTYSIIGTDRNLFSVDINTGVISLSMQDFESATDVNTDNKYDLILVATDTDENTANKSLTITIIDSIEITDFTLSTTSQLFTEENASHNIILTVNGTTIGEISYSLIGADIAFFSVDSVSQTVTLSPQDHEAPVDSGGDNEYTVTVIATDEDGNDDSLTQSIVVTDINDGDYIVLEGAVNTSLSSFSELNSTIIQGQPIDVSIAFQQLYGDTTSNNMLGRYYIIDNIGTTIIDTTVNLGRFGQEENITNFTFSIATDQLSGANNLFVIFNSDTSFIEDNYINNLFSNSFTILADQTPPNLTVTFNNQSIPDGGSVNQNPEIKIVLEDENPFLLKTDLTGVYIEIKPDSCFHKNIIKECYVPVDSNDLSFTPATASSPMVIYYRPDSLLEGEFTLRVRAEDVAENEIISPYEISFSIATNETTASPVVIYPNPCEGECSFGFAFDGLPSENGIEIIISDLSGKTINTLNYNAIEQGWNTIAFKATNFSGEPLENGLYVYKVLFPNTVGQYSEKTIQGRKVLKNFIGKFYIMR